MQKRKVTRAGCSRLVVGGIVLLLGCGLVAQFGRQPTSPTTQPAALFAPELLPTFTNTAVPEAPATIEPTATQPAAIILVATDTPAPLPTEPPTHTPTPLPLPTETPLPVPTDPPAPPTATTAAVEVIAAPIQAAPVLANGSSCDCSGDTYKCDDFASHSEAQACFDYCLAQGAGDIHDLDRDNDLSVCENR